MTTQEPQDRERKALDTSGDVPLRLASAIGGLGWLFVVLVVVWLVMGRP